MTWSRKSASFSSSRVAMKASTSWWGSFWMKPTVSEIRMVSPIGSFSFRVVGSKVAKSLFSANTSALVRLFRRVDFPALV